MTSAGFPHSDISGSTPACDSPKLFAANHVLHRLLTPRHSSCALSSLTTNLLWRPAPRRAPTLIPRKLLVAMPPYSRHAVRARTPCWRSELPARDLAPDETRSRSKLHEGATILDSF